MIKAALVGNIASGKSAAEKILNKFGYKVLDTDKVCHNLLDELGEIAEEFLFYFKDFDVFENEKISREKLGKLVFDNPDLKEKLENILYPHLKIKIKEFFTQNKNEDLVFVAIPLLFEAGMEDLFDKIFFVYCKDEIRLERLIKRNGYSKEYAKVRMNSQMSQEVKIVKSDYIIYNESTLDDLENNIRRAVAQIR